MNFFVLFLGQYVVSHVEDSAKHRLAYSRRPMGKQANEDNVFDLDVCLPF